MSDADINAGSLPKAPIPATHDMGGASRFRCTAVERDEAPPDDFGKRVDALRQLLAQKGLMTVDELRRGIEAIPEDEYLALTYYERWLRSMTALMLEKGVVSEEELR
ncbi:nitrile hydratase subunit beta [Roseomonas sp. KE2513]|uniref:SH3-like domain-containing protein n=1 Tax=Roseomonas sp. KE2513 TaxID=2479202 RepID=UPI0018E0201E|nr:nitrile hydratase subunit beta [Roseomonas sp. KE2513]